MGEMSMKIFKISTPVILVMLLLVACSKDNVPPNTGTLITNTQVLNKFAISNNTLYTVSGYYVSAFDASNSASPVLNKNHLLGLLPSIGNILSYQNYLFLGSQGSLNIYDTNTATPSQRSTYSKYFGCNPVITNGTYAFIILNSNSPCSADLNELDVVDLSDPAKPKLIKTYPMNSPTGFALDGNRLFVCDKILKYYDTTDPANLIMKTLPIKASQVTAQNGLLIVIGDDGLYQYSYTGNTFTQLSKLKTK